MTGMRPQARRASLNWPSLAPDIDVSPVADRMRQAQVRAMHEVIPVAQLASMVCALSVCAILWNRIGHTPLIAWLLTRALISLARTAYSGACRRSPERHSDQIYLMMALADGINWGALGWWLTPLNNLEVAVVTISVCVTASCVGVIMLHVHPRANWIFISPILLPNAIYAWQRGDDLAVFCSASFVGITCVLLIEAQRLHRRSTEVLRMRFESELAHQAERRALEQLQHLTDMRSRFVATISHEMRTPLHGMMGMLRLMRQHPGQAPAAHHLSLMHESGQHLVAVINDLLDFAKLESTGLPISPHPFRLQQTLRSVTEMLRPTCEGKGLGLALEAHLGATDWVLGDDTRIRQILINLLGNAIKFTSSGRITLVAQRDPQSGWTQLQVHDTGAGIPAADLSRIFEPFHQAEGTYERRFGGTGLGLTISRELSKAMGGQLSCISQVGQGSVFTCALPLPDTSPPPSPEPETLPMALDGLQASRLSPPMVLVVDDNAVNTLVAEAELRHFGMDVTVADSGAAALDWLSNNEADLIFMDCEMPGMDGMTTTAALRDLERQQGRTRAPVVALTANGRDAMDARARASGMDDYLGKPFGQSELRAVLCRHLPHAMTRPEAEEATSRM